MVLLQWVSGGVRKLVPGPAKRLARSLRATYRRTRDRIGLGLGVEPYSYLWGNDRGVGLYRYYLLQFLTEFAADVRGRCVEFQEDAYTSHFGGAAVTKVDILHVDDSNPRATLVGDLTKPNNFPSDAFDCIICTHVLHVIPDVGLAVADMHRMLRPGGVLLVAAPCVSMCDLNWHELWRFTEEGLHTLLARPFGAEQVTTRAYGNSLTAAGQIRGLAAHEFTPAELDTHDPRFAVEVCGRACKKT